MKERPILFSAPMVRTILDGSKTQTRRIAKPRRKPSLLEPSEWSDEYVMDPGNREWLMSDNPYGQPGDRLWVKETWTPLENVRTSDPGLDPIQRGLYYRADYPGDTLVHDDRPVEPVKWKSSLFMRRNQSRILLDVTGVRIEQLNDCSEADAITEGIRRELDSWLDYSNPSCQMGINPVDSYRTLWEAINGAGSWAANPWIWVVEFRRVDAELWKAG
ncbi:hypothetical protein ACFQUU_06170 [Herbaspirillum sp. GCM10030257]|uniref:hypothetical protein n=1 Tax=Herbaspirillum sp. GCM10030257 TaxID=3273393 RepID=UPI0036231E22